MRGKIVSSRHVLMPMQARTHVHLHLTCQEGRHRETCSLLWGWHSPIISMARQGPGNPSPHACVWKGKEGSGSKYPPQLGRLKVSELLLKGPGKYIFSSTFGARAAQSHLLADGNSSQEEKQEATSRAQKGGQSTPKCLGSVQHSKQQVNGSHISEIWTTHVTWVLWL